MMGVTAKSYQDKQPLKMFKAAERLKNWKYLLWCNAQGHHFTPFVVLIDGMIGEETRTSIKACI
jgi:hypothetical protein